MASRRLGRAPNLGSNPAMPAVVEHVQQRTRQQQRQLRRAPKNVRAVLRVYEDGANGEKQANTLLPGELPRVCSE
jgi:hypothetical protein